MLESKRVFWEVEVEGAEDEGRQVQEEVEATLEEYKANAKIVKRAVAQVRTKVSRMKHQQWRIEQNMKRDGNRAEALQGSSAKNVFPKKVFEKNFFSDMVDRWSVIHVFVVVAIGIVQVIVLRRFFSAKTGHQRLNVRA